MILYVTAKEGKLSAKGAIASMTKRTKELGGTDGREAQIEPPEHTCSSESKLHPHQEKCGQQVRGGDSPALLCSGENPCGVQHPVLELLL